MTRKEAIKRINESYGELIGFKISISVSDNTNDQIIGVKIGTITPDNAAKTLNERNTIKV